MRRLNADDALAIVVSNPGMYDNRWHEVVGWFANLPNSDDQWSFLKDVSGETLADETVVQVGVALMDLVISREGMDAADQIRRNIDNINFRNMLRCVMASGSPLQMIEGFLKPYDADRRIE